MPPFFILSEVNNQTERAGGTTPWFFFILPLSYFISKANCYLYFLSLKWVLNSMEGV